MKNADDTGPQQPKRHCHHEPSCSKQTTHAANDTCLTTQHLSVESRNREVDRDGVTRHNSSVSTLATANATVTATAVHNHSHHHSHCHSHSHNHNHNHNHSHNHTQTTALHLRPTIQTRPRIFLHVLMQLDYALNPTCFEYCVVYFSASLSVCCSPTSSIRAAGFAGLDRPGLAPGGATRQGRHSH